MSLLTGMLTSD